ncbi:MAG: hypothetical protein U0163_03890 [Gemmatimonadaceae bacterium]
MYRTTVNAGPARSAWDPQVRVQFEKFYQLRARVHNAWLKGNRQSLGCTGLDSALIAAPAC